MVARMRAGMAEIIYSYVLVTKGQKHKYFLKFGSPKRFNDDFCMYFKIYSGW